MNAGNWIVSKEHGIGRVVAIKSGLFPLQVKFQAGYSGLYTSEGRAGRTQPPCIKRYDTKTEAKQAWQELQEDCKHD